MDNYIYKNFICKVNGIDVFYDYFGNNRIVFDQGVFI